MIGAVTALLTSGLLQQADRYFLGGRNVDLLALVAPRPGLVTGSWFLGVPILPAAWAGSVAGLAAWLWIQLADDQPSRAAETAVDTPSPSFGAGSLLKLLGTSLFGSVLLGPIWLTFSVYFSMVMATVSQSEALGVVFLGLPGSCLLVAAILVNRIAVCGYVFVMGAAVLAAVATTAAWTRSTRGG